MMDLLGWLRDRVGGDRDGAPEPDPAAERAVKLPPAELPVDGPEDVDRDG